MRVLRAVFLALACLAGPVAGQEAAPGAELPLGQLRSPILTIDRERVFVESLFGQRVVGEWRTASLTLASENDEIKAALDAEELSLTDRRATMPVDEFRALAEQFDARATAIREAQDAKLRDLQRMVDDGKARFFEAATPILFDIMRGAGAAVILDRRSVFASAVALDVTDEAIAEIDARIGDGAGLAAPGQGDEVPAEPAP